MLSLSSILLVAVVASDTCPENEGIGPDGTCISLCYGGGNCDYGAKESSFTDLQSDGFVQTYTQVAFMENGWDAYNWDIGEPSLPQDDGRPSTMYPWTYEEAEERCNTEETCVGYFLHAGGSIVFFRESTSTRLIDNNCYKMWAKPAPPVCDAADMTALNWHNLMNVDENPVDDLLHSSSIEFDASTLSLTFSASLEYVGLSADGNFDDEYNLGTTYWVDFQSFSASNAINAPGSCGNRDGDDYSGLDFANYWGYTVNPADLESAETAERMAYPPSDWTFGVDDASSCNVVNYERTFSWTELTACTGSGDSVLVEVTETPDAITMSGTLFIELVSPYSMSSSAYYRTFPVVQQDFGIVLDRTVDVLASTGVQLFITSIMAYGRDEEGNKYTLTVFTQSADYVKLGVDNAVTVDSPLSISDIQTETGSDCLVAGSFTCGQIFELTVDASCPADGTGAVDLSGTHSLSFSPQCQTLADGSADPACTTYLSTLTDGKVVLDVESSFTDNCDVDLWAVEFSGSLAFYKDDAFTEEADGSDPFVIGQDTIYGKVTVDTQSDSSGGIYEFVDVEIESVFVCTVDPDNEDDIALDASSVTGGCFSEYIDADGPYNVFGSGAVTDYQGTVYDPSGNEATFSFLTFDTPRETIQVHVQLLLSLVDVSGRRRVRRVLLQDDETGNAFKSYMQSTAVQSSTDANTDGIEVEDGAVGQSVAFVSAFLGVVAWIMG